MIFAQASGTTFGRMLVDAASLGSIYALLAMGFVIIFKATQVLNFAHGALAALGAFLVASFATLVDIPGRWMGDAPRWLTWTLSVLLALAVAVAIGMLLERVFIRPMVGEELFAVAIVTLGLDVVIRTFTNDFIGNQARPLGDPFGSQLINTSFVNIPYSVIAQVAVTGVLVVLVALFFRSRMGIAMQATAFDQEAARAQGIDVGRVFAIAWGIGAGLAAVAGIFLAVFPRHASGVDNSTAFFAFAAFPAIILGGLDSVVGAVVGGFVIGLAQALATAYLSGVGFLGTGFGGVVPYLVMLIVLLVKPYGFFGSEEIRRV
ncbi:MAG: branched-chain amino acid ABC transporter permease [Acidimicrobiia bacterium]